MGRYGALKRGENAVRVARTRRGRMNAGAIAILAATMVPQAASATDCNTLPNPLYGIGGSSHKPLIARFAARLAASVTPQTIVYQAPGACGGINALLGHTAMTGNASYWDAAGAEHQCALPLAGQQADFANMGNTATSCPGVSALPADIGDFTGPVSSYNLVVPNASSQQSISAAAAYFVWGFGHDGQAAPWTDETNIFKRDANSAAQLFVSLASGVPVERLVGVDTHSNSGTITALRNSTTPEAAIGFVSGDVADANRAYVRTLAYQHLDQTCGYWPDSTATSFDKRNVRDGQYYLWAPTHFFARIDDAGHIVNPGAASFIGYFTGAVTPPANLDPLTEEIQSGNIPQCAMHVWRTTDLGALMSYQPPEPCGCYFDSVATGATSCTPCADSTTCPSSAHVCRHHYCEVQ